jgi:2-methylisocitrate lyase-like PEP mutase family enzyme
MKTTATQDHLRRLHNDESPLLLPNAWDAGSAARAIARVIDVPLSLEMEGDYSSEPSRRATVQAQKFLGARCSKGLPVAMAFLSQV